MKPIQTSMVAMSLLALAGCSLQPFCPGDIGFQYRNCNPQGGATTAKPAAHDWAADLAAAKRENAAFSDRARSLESQLADRDRELASLRSSAGDSSKLASQLSSAQSDLDQAKARAADLERQLAAAQSASGDKDRLASDLAAAQSQLASLQAGAGEKDKLATELAAAQSQLASLQAGAGEKDKLAAELAAAQSQLASLQAGAGEKDKLATELTSAKQHIAELEAQLAAAQSSGADKDKLAADLAAAKQRVAELEKQLADRDRELAGLRGELSAEMAKLKEAQRGLIRALKPQIDQRNIAVDLNNERLLINLASGYLFGSGEDQLKPAGADALKQVGAILKDFPEYKVHVEGHTDNRPIRSTLKQKFPSNKELSEARAANAVKALADGGLTNAHAMGAADTKPVMPNSTDAGRAKNRRVEISVTK